MKKRHSLTMDKMGICPDYILEALNWNEYMEITSKPFPLHLVDTPENRKKHKNWKPWVPIIHNNKEKNFIYKILNNKGKK